ncbi:MAG: DUF192 domain-containing protein [Rhodobacteraceae bacterium]|nr:DUF192 domain-containing protein [Paracoccaceae bacterium]
MGSGRAGAGGVKPFALAALLAALAGSALADCRDDQVEFRGPGGAARFTVDVARTEAERELGLMNRSAMPASAGMLFVFDGPTHAQFWMKDTLIPLDMIFVDPAGQVTRVKANARPEDLSIIDGGRGVEFVVEINAGLAGKLGIAPGAAMRSPEVPQAGAIWPCGAP